METYSAILLFVAGFLSHMFIEIFKRRERYRERVFDKVTNAIAALNEQLQTVIDAANNLDTLPNNTRLNTLKNELWKLTRLILTESVYLTTNLTTQTKNFATGYYNKFCDTDQTPSEIKLLCKAFFIDVAYITFRFSEEVGMVDLGGDFSKIFKSKRKRIKHAIKRWYLEQKSK